MDTEYGERLEIALILIAIAGYVDANGFITLSNLFVSFMSGNSTQFAVHAAEGTWNEAAPAGAIVALFLGGVMAGRLLARLRKSRRRPIILIVEAAVLGFAQLGAGSRLISVIPLVLAMGIQNAAIHRIGDTKLSVTYVTGTLVHAGEKFVDGVFDSTVRWSWLPFFLLWVGMVFGGAVGTVLNLQLGRQALIVPAALLTILAIVSAVLLPEE